MTMHDPGVGAKWLPGVVFVCLVIIMATISGVVYGAVWGEVGVLE